MEFTDGNTIILAVVVALLIGSTVYLQSFYVDFKHIEGIPEIQGGTTLAGHLHLLGEDHASTLEKWSDENAWPIFQIRLGNRRAIILNSFEITKDWMVTRQASTIDRPWLYTFHGVVSKTSGKFVP